MEFKTQVWDVQWKIYRYGVDEPECTQRRFRTFEGAQKKTQELISEKFSDGIDLLSYLQELRKGPHTSYRIAIADFIEKLILSGAFFESKKQIPSFSAKDYPCDKYNKYKNINIWRDDAGNQIEDNEIYTAENKFEIFGSPHPENMTFRYPHGAYPKIRTDIHILDKKSSNRYISFSFQFKFIRKEMLEYGQISEFVVTLRDGFETNKSTYSAQILELLKRSDKPLKQHEIAEIIGVDRKTVWRNIGALVEAGAKIEKDEHNAYYLSQTGDRLSYEDIDIIKKSIVLNPNISTEEKERLMELLSKI